MKENPELVIKSLAAEVVRLTKLCNANGIDPTPPTNNPGATMSVKAKVQVFSTKEEADEHLKKTMEAQ